MQTRLLYEYRVYAKYGASIINYYYSFFIKFSCHEKNYVGHFSNLTTAFTNIFTEIVF